MPQHLHEPPRGAPPPPVDVVTRRAHIRAIAAGLVDGPRMGRRFHIPAGVALQASPRHRKHAGRPRSAPAEPKRGPMLRRLVGAGLLLAQVALLCALLLAPAFKVHAVDLRGERLLSRSAVLGAARIPESSLFTLDDEAIRSRIAALPWVRSATVTTQLPSTVNIAVTEWQPAVLLRHGSDATYIAANGAVLPFTQSTESARRGTPLLLDYRAGPQQPLPSGFAELLGGAAQRWSATFGCTLDAFVINNSNIFSAWCHSGWQAVFGALDSSQAAAAIPGQLAVLAALRGRLDFASPAFAYVDLENPGAPAAGGKPGEPPALTSDISGSILPSSPAPPGVPAPASRAAPTAAAGPAAAPTPTPAPTPRPTPTPLVFTLASPSPTPRH